MNRFIVLAAAVSTATAIRSARADDAAAPTGAPPPEAKALVAAPKGPADAPDITKQDDGTTATLSAGAMQTTGNSRTLAATMNGSIDSRFDANGVGGGVLANYGQGAKAGDGVVATTQNVQGRVRYDRYVIQQASFFLIATGRHDRFQGIDFRLNLDPGFKYIFVKDKTQSLWGEAGYDFQYDVRRDDARFVLDANDKPTFDASGAPILLDKTKVDHSARLFAGYRHAFNKEVNFALGAEYLQSVVDSTRWRLNTDALIAAKIVGGLAFGVGITARYDHDPLPGKEQFDTSTTANLIWAYSNIADKAPATCPCPPPPPPPPPEPGPPTSDADRLTPAPAPATDAPASPAPNPGE